MPLGEIKRLAISFSLATGMVGALYGYDYYSEAQKPDLSHIVFLDLTCGKKNEPSYHLLLTQKPDSIAARPEQDPAYLEMRIGDYYEFLLGIIELGHQEKYKLPSLDDIDRFWLRMEIDLADVCSQRFEI